MAKHICYKEGELGTMTQQLKDLKEGQDRIEGGQNRFETKFDDFVKTLDCRYASKLTEKIVYGLCGTILLAVISAVIYLVII